MDNLCKLESKTYIKDTLPFLSLKGLKRIMPIFCCWTKQIKLSALFSCIMSIYTNLAGIVERSKWVYDFYFDKSGKLSVMDAIHVF